MVEWNFKTERTGRGGGDGASEEGKKGVALLHEDLSLDRLDKIYANRNDVWRFVP